MAGLCARIRRTATFAFPTLALAALPALAEDIGAYLAARTAVVQGDYAAASQWFAEAVSADPGNRQLLEGLIASEMGLGDIADAAKAAGALATSGGDSQIANFARVADAALREDYAAILSANAGELRIGDVLDQLVRAWAEVGLGRMSDALAAFDAVAARPGAEAFGLYHKALALGLAGDFEGSDAILSGQAAGPITLTKSGTLAHVQILSQLERNADATKLLDERLGREPDPVIDALRARLAAGEPLPFDAVRSGRDGIAEVFFTLANQLVVDATPTFAYLHARIAMALNPAHEDAVLLSAGLLERMGQPDLAAKTYAEITPDSPAFVIAEIGRAGALYTAGGQEEAIAVLQALSRTHGGYYLVQTALGDAMRRSERFPECAEAYQAAAKLIPEIGDRHWGLLYSTAICMERQSKWTEAEALFRQALALNPDQPQVLNYLGYSLVDRGEKLEEALGMIERAVAAEPQSGYIVDSLAWALYRLGRIDEALAPMERASLLEPLDPIVTDHLGDVYWAVGRVREARFQWHRALSLDPAETDADRIRRKLEAGLDAVLAEEGAQPLPGRNAAANDTE
jgi:tetratricopeptide (TPR) repeat protein